MSYDDFRMRTEHPPAERPVVVWDGDCGFCRSSVDRIAYQVGDRIDRAPYQQVADRFPDIPEPLFAQSVHLIETDGRIHVGAGAVFRALSYRPDGGGAGWWCYRKLPGFAGASELVYTLVARHRPLMTRLTRWFVGPDLLPRQYRLTRWLLLRLLGVAALCAFVSMYVQMDGLFLSGGIEPAGDFLESVRRVVEGADRYLSVPTLAWVSTGDTFLTALALAGIALSVLLIVDVVPGPALLGMWITYLSLVQVGGVFFRYQWDTLLLEALFCAMFFAPWRVRPRLATDREPGLAGVWLLRLLAFKLMFLAGAVKLLADDPVWNDLSALEYHFFTQPIPTWTAYYAHHLPAWLLAGAVVATFAAELVLPWLTFGPRRLRIAFCVGTLLLMLMIGATGNYGFFNLVTVAIAVSLLDDTALRRLVPRRWRDRVPDPSVPPPHMRSLRTRRAVWACAAVVIAISALGVHRRLHRDSRLGQSVMERVSPFLSINDYGLFANMTIERPEIVVEGSRDGEHWASYEFRWKAGPLDARPRFTGPHMPRLDWQMWFAALRGCRGAAWLHRFMRRLLMGAPDVRALLARDPFGDDPPRYIRTTVYHYTFAPLSSDDWWQRERVGAFCPTVTLRDGQLVRARFADQP